MRYESFIYGPEKIYADDGTIYAVSGDSVEIRRMPSGQYHPAPEPIASDVRAFAVKERAKKAALTAANRAENNFIAAAKTFLVASGYHVETKCCPEPHPLDIVGGGNVEPYEGRYYDVLIAPDGRSLPWYAWTTEFTTVLRR